MNFSRFLKSTLSFFIVIFIIFYSFLPSSALTYKQLDKNHKFHYGVDVSVWNDDLDWKVLRNNGIEFAYIRIGYFDNKGGHLDKRFKQNVIGCIENGIEFGVYVYSYVYKASDNVSCAKWINKELKAMGNYCKDRDTIQVAYDIEDEVQIRALTEGYISKDYLQRSVDRFCEKIKDYGYIPTVYSFASFFKDYLNVDKFQKNGVKIWLAQWPGKNTLDVTKKKKFLNIQPDVWQYACTFEIAGTIFDTNVCYDEFYDYANEDSSLTIQGLKKYYKFTGKTVTPKFNVYYKDKILKKNLDYKVIYFNNVEPGQGRIKVIRFKNGEYLETKTFTFIINPPPVFEIKKKSSSSSIELKWREVENAEFYQIYFYDEYLGGYSLLEETEDNHTDIVDLQSGKLYKFKIRAVQKIDKVFSYGTFSKVRCRTK